MDNSSVTSVINILQSGKLFGIIEGSIMMLESDSVLRWRSILSSASTVVEVIILKMRFESTSPDAL